MNIDSLVEDLLDIAREQSHSDAVIIIRDRIQKDIVKPLKRARKDERERAAKIAESHYTNAVECNGGSECSLNIAAAIRRDSAQEGEQSNG